MDSKLKSCDMISVIMDLPPLHVLSFEAADVSQTKENKCIYTSWLFVLFLPWCIYEQ